MRLAGVYAHAYVLLKQSVQSSHRKTLPHAPKSSSSPVTLQGSSKPDASATILTRIEAAGGGSPRDTSSCLAARPGTPRAPGAGVPLRSPNATAVPRTALVPKVPGHTSSLLTVPLPAAVSRHAAVGHRSLVPESEASSPLTWAGKGRRSPLQPQAGKALRRPFREAGGRPRDAPVGPGRLGRQAVRPRTLAPSLPEPGRPRPLRPEPEPPGSSSANSPTHR